MRSSNEDASFSLSITTASPGLGPTNLGPKPNWRPIG
jgi:hypothetical protein